MRELEREPSSKTTACASLAIIGQGRLGTSLASAFRQAGLDVVGPLGRGADGAGADAVLLCVPDQEIVAAAAAIAPGRPVGHCSGATGLDVLGAHDAFSLHPLMTVTASGADFTGAGAAVAGSTAGALQLAGRLAAAIGMDAVEIAEHDRPAYHAAASIASNFLITLEAAAERLAASTGTDRALLVPLVRATVENWAELGAERALTGPVARGDEATVASQRAAVAQRAEELLPLFDALVDATQALPRESTRREPLPRESLAAEPLPRESLAAEPPAGEAPELPATAGRMRLLRTIAELRAALNEPRRAGRVIGLVPTMGAFHEGHLSLMRRARRECDEVVVTLFVNPAQFDEDADLAAYPRDPGRDAQLAAELGVDYLFAPTAEEVYPPGFDTTVSVGGLTETLEGAHRGRGHFDGVTTVVTKLFNIASPNVAYFGQKDAQQALVIKRLARDLDMPVRIEVCPTVRAPDGLAMSSRNARLSAAERERATSLHRALRAADEAVCSGARDPAEATARARSELSSARIEPEYLELVSADTLTRVSRIEGDVLALIAAQVGETRLIDNHLLSTVAAGNGSGGKH